jgi:CubicO group peptidase (beta-lactamase class C family)
MPARKPDIKEARYSAAHKKYFLCFLLFFISGISSFSPDSSILSQFKGQTMAHNFNPGFLYSEEELEYLDHQITNVLIDSGFNGTVLISRYGMVIYERAFGFAGTSKAEPLNMETSFQLASISKTFTATAVLLLQEQGLLNVTDKVNQYIPEFPYDNITIQHLLSHTSGLQNYMWLLERRWTQRNFPTNEDVLKLFVETKRPLNFRPGQRFEYSNSGFVFLGLLIERVSGKTYAEFIHEHIFDPLEMDRSFVYDLQKEISIENRAYGFRQVRGRNNLIPDDKLDGPLGDKGVFSSAGDLYKWDQAIHRSELLPPDVWELAFTHARLNNDSLVNYGMGWRLQTYLDKKIVHHPGRWHGFRTSFKRFADDHTTLIILSNNDRNIVGIIEKVQDIIYYDEREIWLATNSDETLPDEELNDTLEDNSTYE